MLIGVQRFFLAVMIRAADPFEPIPTDVLEEIKEQAGIEEAWPIEL